MAKYNLVNFETEDEFVNHIVTEFKTLADEAISARGKFQVALSGGHTPAPVLTALKKVELDWSKIHIYWSDERYVSHSDTESNFGMAKRLLLSHIAIPELNIHGIDTSLVDPHESAKKYEELIRDIQMDLIYLGIGSDGHTASLFPGISFSFVAKVSAIFVRKLGTYRISMLPDYINSAREIRFLVSGSDKRTVLSHLVRAKDSDVTYPCQLIRACTIVTHGV